MVWQKEYSICYDKRHIPRLSTVSNSERHLKCQLPCLLTLIRALVRGLAILMYQSSQSQNHFTALKRLLPKSSKMQRENIGNIDAHCVSHCSDLQLFSPLGIRFLFFNNNSKTFKDRPIVISEVVNK